MFQLDTNIQLAKQYGLPSVRDRIEFASCDTMVQFNIQQVEAAVLAGLSSGVLRIEQLRGKVVDFGCGRGVSTAVFETYGADVLGVELDPTQVAKGGELGLVSPGKLKCGDGIAHLNSLTAGSLDLVNASMLGPDIDGTLCRNFLFACRHALKPGGTVLITSDAGTLETTNRVNTLSNGFITQGVFLAVRGVDSEWQPDLPSNQLSEFSKLTFAGVDLSAFFREFNLRGKK